MMSHSNWEKFENFYHLLCVIATCGLIAYSVNYYAKDKDVSFIAYKIFNEGPEYLYPSISLYFHNPFYDEELRRYGDDINSTTYSAFLSGDISDSRMAQIDYDNVTINSEDNLFGVKITYNNYTTKFFSAGKLNLDNIWKLPYVSYRSVRGKAITLDIPQKRDLHIIFLELIFKKGIFPNKTRPSKMRHDPKTLGLIDGFEVLFHLPGQFMLGNAKGLGKWNWPKLDNHHDENIKMKFTIRNVDMLKLRNKRNGFCHENFLKHDQIIFNNAMDEGKCRPFYYPTKRRLPICNSTELKKYFIKSPNNVITKFKPPCQSISKVQFDFEDVYSSDYEENGNNKKDLVIVGIDIMDQLFNQVEQTQAYNIDNLIGEIGGYLGDCRIILINGICCL